MTLDELEQCVKFEIAGKPYVYSRFDGMECQSSLLLNAIAQIKRSVMLVQSGILEPKDCAAETYLMSLLSVAAISHKGIGK